MTTMQCPCCDGTGQVEWPPRTRTACPMALEAMDLRMRRMHATLERWWGHRRLLAPTQARVLARTHAPPD